MKLLLRRTQHPSVLGPPTFTLDVRAETTPEDKANIAKYRLGDALLFEKNKLADRGSGLLGLITRILFHATNLTISVRDLAEGKRIQCKSIIEMLDMENSVKEAAQNFGAVMHAAAHFGGEEVVPL